MSVEKMRQSRKIGEFTVTITKYYPSFYEMKRLDKKMAALLDKIEAVIREGSE